MVVHETASTIHVAHRVGRRGCFLLFLTLLDWIYGYSLLFPTETSRNTPTSIFLIKVAPLAVWGLLWLVTGLMCCIHAFRVKDAAGYAAAMFLKVLWGVMFLLGWIFAGVERGYLSTTIWLAFAGILAIIATWPDDMKTAHRTAPSE